MNWAIGFERMPSATLNRIVMDSVHGVCDLDNDMREIVDTPQIQRLRLVPSDRSCVSRLPWA